MTTGGQPEAAPPAVTASSLEDLQKQLLELRSRLPELMQVLATFDHQKTNRQTFYEVAQDVALWHSAATQFAQNYTQLKQQGALSQKIDTTDEPQLPEPMDLENGNEFDYAMDLNSQDLGSMVDLDMDMGMGQDSALNDFLDF